jgi:tRNA G46 methylase TrmB
MRNPKYMNDVLNNCDFYYDLKTDFNNNKPIMLEIGMGKGDFILNMALNHP